MAYETPLTIAEVVKNISNNRYVLPSIQREFVWSTSQIERLFDSLMQEYPIGTFLFWEISKDKYQEYDFYKFIQNYHELNTHNEKADLRGEENITAILDGQQRLTSLYIGLKGSYAYKLPHKHRKSEGAFPKRHLYLNILEPCNEDNEYEFAFLTDDEAKNTAQKYWFEVGNILDMTSISDVLEYVDKNLLYETYTAEHSKYARNILAKLQEVIHKQNIISYYREKSEQLDKVLNIFIRVNSGGTVLSYSDLLLSVAAAQWESDAREQITDLVDELNAIGMGFNVNKDFVLKAALVLCDIKNIKFKVDNFNKTNMSRIEENWKVVRKALFQATNLVASFGYSRETLKSNNAIIPIAYYLMVIGLPNNFETSSSTAENRDKIKKWLIRALLKGSFGGGPDAVLTRIRDVIRENGKNDFPLERIIDSFRGTSKSIIFSEDDIDEYLLKKKYGSPEILSILMLLYPSIDYSNKFHIDHMYPRSNFSKKKLLANGVDIKDITQYMDSVNDMGNLQILPATCNIEKQNKDFDAWLKIMCPTEEKMKEYQLKHGLPSCEYEYYSYPNFLTFISQRKMIIRKVLKKILL